ncbi:hypothetical protein DPMN_192191 [Dreissena polymorpha]|uniref:Uncharacterized protein n=1 Tax=Dreissena polymorpha TaxID=45954 RepID=A0A9D3XYL7_DREPO|nr:hypothetical protein DPMN_192191 [Dreissena polymorpha]
MARAPVDVMATFTASIVTLHVLALVARSNTDLPVMTRVGRAYWTVRSGFMAYDVQTCATIVWTTYA